MGYVKSIKIQCFYVFYKYFIFIKLKNYWENHIILLVIQGGIIWKILTKN